MEYMRANELSFRHRMWSYRIKQEKLRRDIKEWLDLVDCNSCRASFPDSGYYYAQKERQMVELYTRVIMKLPKKKQILLWHQADQTRKKNEAYYEPIECNDGVWRSPYELDEMMVYH